MTEQEKQIKRYVNEIDRRLRLPLKLRARIGNDLGTDIHARLEAGQSMEQIMAEMGTPEQVAAGFRTALCREEKRSPWRFAFLILAVLLLLLLAIQGASYLGQTNAAPGSAAIIGGADGPTAIYVTGTFVPVSSFSVLRAVGLLLGCGGSYLLLSGSGNKKNRAAIWMGAAGLVAFLLRSGIDGAQFLEMSKLIELPQTAFSLWAMTVANLMLYPSFWLPLVVLVVALRRKHREKTEPTEK